MKKGLLTFIFIVIAIGIVFATTWFEDKIKCPVCGKTNKFQVIGSYGSYIYSWPEKLEFIYWPVTETYSMYTCKNCKYSAFLWDFNHIGKDTLKIITSELAKLKLSASGYNSKMSAKLESAELIYRLYKHDPDFWCWFYRIKGHHYNAEGNPEKAKIERLKALSIADSLLNISTNVYRKKELLFITGSMKHFTQQDSASIKDINIALSLTYNDAKLDSAKNSNFNLYLDGLLSDLKSKIYHKE